MNTFVYRYALLLSDFFFIQFCRNHVHLNPQEAVPQLILTTKKSLLLWFKALFVFLFLVFLDCWTTSQYNIILIII